MKETPLKRFEARPDVIRSKRLIGMIYGIVSGLAFAVATWGWDGYSLSRSHAYLPWLNLSVALVFCAVVGAAAGWLTARFESSLLGSFFWLISASLFAWLVNILPLQVSPFIVSKINPQLGGLLNYTKDAEIGFRFGLAAAWIIPFALIVGVTQLPITESSVFSTSFFGKIIPFFFGIAVICISGTFADSMINAHFRDAITSIDNTIQFTLDNKNNPQMDEDLARKMHASSLDAVKEYVVESRYLLVRGYDKTFGQIHVLIRFEDKWVDCMIIYAQPSFCKVAD
ncbi:MAG TPA: hypothetical protein VII97_02390 [Anaerolineales bacterium]